MAIHRLELEICVENHKNISSSQDQHLRMRKIRITKGIHRRNVCYKRETFWGEIFVRFLLSFGVRVSLNEAQFARQKKLFRATIGELRDTQILISGFIRAFPLLFVWQQSKA